MDPLTQAFYELAFRCAFLEKRGELKEAGRWYLTSAKDGEARAACALGFLLRDAEIRVNRVERLQRDNRGAAREVLPEVHLPEAEDSREGRACRGTDRQGARHGREADRRDERGVRASLKASGT